VPAPLPREMSIDVEGRSDRFLQQPFWSGRALNHLSTRSSQ